MQADQAAINGRYPMIRSRLSQLVVYGKGAGLYRAAAPALASKFVSVITSWLLLPLLAVRMGPDDFAVYALYVSLLSVLNLADSGMGTALVKVAAAAENFSPRFLLALFWRGARFFRYLAVFLLAASLFVLARSHLERMHLSGKIAIVAGLTLAAVQVWIIPVGRVFAGAGMMELWNRFSIVSNLAFLLSVLAGLLISSPDCAISFLVIGHALSLLVLPLLALIHLRHLARGERTEPIHSAGFPVVQNVPRALISEAKHQLPAIISGMLQRELPKWAVLGVFPARDLGRLSLLLTLLTGVGGIVAMFTGIIWPKIVTAWSKGDIDWVRGSRRFLYSIYGLFVVLISAVLLGAFLHGGGHLKLKDYQFTGFELCLFGAFAALVLWDHTNYVILLALGRLKLVAQAVFAQATIVAVVWVTLPCDNSLVKYFVAQITAYFLCSAWLFPLAVKSQLEGRR